MVECTRGQRLARPGIPWIGWALLCPLLGCGTYESTVTGLVTIDGAPVDKGTVSFSPKTSSDMGSGAYADIDAEGRYDLRTGGERGLHAGDYLVSVVVSEVLPPPAEGFPPPGARLISPKKYSNGETSGLECVVERGSNVFDIQMTSGK